MTVAAVVCYVAGLSAVYHGVRSGRVGLVRWAAVALAAGHLALLMPRTVVESADGARHVVWPVGGWLAFTLLACAFTALFAPLVASVGTARRH